MRMRGFPTLRHGLARGIVLIPTMRGLSHVYGVIIPNWGITSDGLCRA